MEMKPMRINRFPPAYYRVMAAFYITLLPQVGSSLWRSLINNNQACPM